MLSSIFTDSKMANQKKNLMICKGSQKKKKKYSTAGVADRALALGRVPERFCLIDQVASSRSSRMRYGEVEQARSHRATRNLVSCQFMKYRTAGVQKLYAREPACIRLMIDDILLLLCQLEIGYQMFLISAMWMK